jgi:hypothetical protein
MEERTMTMPAPQGFNDPNPPPLPGVGVPQPSAAERAAIENEWKALRDARKSIAELILFIDAHPELIAWAKASVAGTVRLND